MLCSALWATSFQANYYHIHPHVITGHTSAYHAGQGGAAHFHPEDSILPRESSLVSEESEPVRSVYVTTAWLAKEGIINWSALYLPVAACEIAEPTAFVASIEFQDERAHAPPCTPAIAPRSPPA